MTTVRLTRRVSPEVLAPYGLAEPEQAAPHLRAPTRLPVESKPERWTTEKRQAFKLLGARAVYLSTTPVILWIKTVSVDGGEVRLYGGNRGFRPLKIGTMRSWRDTVTRLHDVIPHVHYGKPQRIWLHSHDDVPRLVKAATDMLAVAAENGAYALKLGSGLLNLGPDGDLARLATDLREEARYRQIIAWGDHELSLLLDRACAFARAKGIVIVDKRGRGINHPWFVRLIDRLIEREWRKTFGGRCATR